MPRARTEGYEEYHPYGSTAWWSRDGDSEVSQKRYRYTGMERDEETGLQCHGVRYYAVWLGRWVSADPIGLGDGVNRFAYCHGGPVGGRDETGMGDDDGPPPLPSGWTDITGTALASAAMGVLFDTRAAGDIAASPDFNQWVESVAQGAQQTENTGMILVLADGTVIEGPVQLGPAGGTVKERGQSVPGAVLTDDVWTFAAFHKSSLSTELSGIVGVVDAHNHFEPDGDERLAQAQEVPSVNAVDENGDLAGDGRTWSHDGAGGAPFNTPPMARTETEGQTSRTWTLRSDPMYIPVAHVVAAQTGSTKFSVTVLPAVYTANRPVLERLGESSPYSFPQYGKFMSQFIPEARVYSGNYGKSDGGLRLYEPPAKPAR